MATAPRRFRRALPLAAAGALVLAFAFAAGAWASHPRFEKRGALFTMTQGEFVYSFDAAWRTERLDRLGEISAPGAPALAAREPETASRLRDAMLAHLGVASLAEIAAEGTAELEALRAIGYL